MAKRQSLKDLQERLAQRLTAAKAETSTATWLAVSAGGTPYLLPLVQSAEIFPWTTVQTVPYTKPWYAGVTSLRGGLYGVVDLARLTGRESSTSALPPVERVSSETRLVGVHAALGINAVLWVDRLLGLRNPSMFGAVAQRPPDAPDYFARSLVDHHAQTWQELDLKALVADPGFLAIAA